MVECALSLKQKKKKRQKEILRDSEIHVNILKSLLFTQDVDKKNLYIKETFSLVVFWTSGEITV